MALSNIFNKIVLYYDNCGDVATVLNGEDEILGACAYSTLPPNEQFEIAISVAYYKYCGK